MWRLRLQSGTPKTSWLPKFCPHPVMAVHDYCKTLAQASKFKPDSGVAQDTSPKCCNGSYDSKCEKIERVVCYRSREVVASVTRCLDPPVSPVLCNKDSVLGILKRVSSSSRDARALGRQRSERELWSVTMRFSIYYASLGRPPKDRTQRV